MTSLPLAGITILDLSRLLPGPMCSQHLADMGADVIKVEDPGIGDYARWSGKPQAVNSPFFLALNRNKRSVCLDLKKPEAVELLKQLVAKADIVLESFRPGVTARLGCDYETLKAINPRLVYCSVTGYGQTGPLSTLGGHDINFIAEAGISDQNGPADGPPMLSNFQIADLAGGALSAAMGILAALFDAQRSGQGRHVDVSMTDCAMAHSLFPLVAKTRTGQAAPRGTDRLTGGTAAYGYYRTADDRFLAVGALEPQFWQRLCVDVIDRPDLVKPSPDQAVQLGEILADIFAARPLAEWRQRLAGVDCCVNPVLTPDEAMDSPHVRERQLVIRHPHPVEGEVLQYAFPIKMTDFDFAIRRPAPMLGEHTAEILGLSPERAEELARCGITAIVKN
ncbi:MAG: CaiB/BaiF CoA transferase family protein [Magnetospirillum sp.]